MTVRNYSTCAWRCGRRHPAVKHEAEVQNYLPGRGCDIAFVAVRPEGDLGGFLEASCEDDHVFMNRDLAVQAEVIDAELHPFRVSLIRRAVESE